MTVDSAADLSRDARRQTPKPDTWASLAANRRIGPFLVLAASLIAIGGCATIPSEDRVPHDPYESFNRQIFAFNEAADRAVVKPAAKGYSALPSPIRTGAGNFLNNLRDVTTLGNNLLQLKPMDAVSDILRISFNTVFGLGGLIDIASEMGIERNDEDFGQTLGVYGVGPGPYLMLPLVGPSSPREFTGFLVDSEFLDPRFRLTRGREPLRYGLLALSIVDTRARLLSTDDLLRSISDDRYVAIREAYRQRREFLVSDGTLDLDDGLLDELDDLDALDDLDGSDDLDGLGDTTNIDDAS